MVRDKPAVNGIILHVPRQKSVHKSVNSTFSHSVTFCDLIKTLDRLWTGRASLGVSLRVVKDY